MKRLHVDRARGLRRGTTDAERLLWHHLRDRRLFGWKFRRQHEIDRYIVDFACADAMPVVELDGGQHTGRANGDALRTAKLQSLGYRIIRFWNDAVSKETQGVLEAIVEALASPAPHPGPLPGGEREQATND